jgi:hypothetical protein
MGLPQHIDRVSFCRAPDQAEGGLFAVVTPELSEGTFDAVVLDAKGNCHIELGGYRTVALPNAIAAEPLDSLHAVMA